VGGVLHSLDIVIAVVLVAGACWFLWRHWPRRATAPEHE
jgi:hypothetical protein